MALKLVWENSKISLSLYATNLKLIVSSENEKVDTEEAYDESTCLKSAPWFVPILENKFAREGSNQQANKTKQYPNQLVSPVCNNEKYNVEFQSKLMNHSMTKRSLPIDIKRCSSPAI